MRNLYSLLLGLLFFSLLLFPLLAGKRAEDEPQKFENGYLNTEQETGTSFKIKTEKGIITLSEEDYILGVVAAEMPALYEPEALKAQAVAAYTYAARARAAAKDAEYHLTTDSSLHQAYIDKEARSKKWGEKAAEYEKKIAAAVAEVKGETVTYKGELIFAAYHAISSGRTEKAENVWGKEIPYLCGVESVSDLLHENYKSEVKVTLADFCKKLELTAPADSSAIKTEIGRSEAGTVLSFKIFGKEFGGSDIRGALSLRSSNFTVEYKEGNFLFTVKGYGHGVGMSQYGANCMAKMGSSYKEILRYYYPGCEIKKAE